MTCQQYPGVFTLCEQVFYLSPLSTLLHVLRSKSSASLHLPLSIMTIVNGGLWVGYGLAEWDP